MPVRKDEPLALREEPDIVRVRHAVRNAARDLGFSLIDQTKLVTAASELARNALIHGRGGACRIETLEEHGRVGLRLFFEDQGPGIADVEQALMDGYSTRGGLGLGLGGARRLVNDFQIESEVGRGTRVTVVRWK